MTSDERIAYQTARATKWTAEAVASLETGFASEARRKQALADLNRAYDALRDVERERILPTLWIGDERDLTVQTLLDAIPFDLHQFRDKQAAALASRPDFVEEVKALVALRAEIKAAKVEPKPVREDHPLLVFAKTANVDFAALRDRRAGQYQDALDLGRMLRDRKGEPLKGLPVSVNRVFCGNYAGTTWVRIDWFLSGNRVPFSTVAAAYQTLVDEGVIVEDRD